MIKCEELTMFQCNTVDFFYQSTVKEISKYDPNKPFEEETLRKLWQLYEKRVINFIKQIKPHFANLDLTAYQLHYVGWYSTYVKKLFQFQKDIYFKTVQREKCIKNEIKRQSYLPVPDFDEQALAQLIFPDHPTYHEYHFNEEEAVQYRVR
ncbi:hypothetical protein [Legionella fairfieldensis]|uniref:hypothetical protein n=1 Tax=Legionella fairfieldensis TaxID=45064 RepID=UPI00048FB102|nr:hypothetical protein [Legionella fairfieldensis]